MEVTKEKKGRGGRRKGAGRPAIAGKGNGRKSRQFSITNAEAKFLRDYGNGNRSAGFRLLFDWVIGLCVQDKLDDAALLAEFKGLRNAYRSRDTGASV